MPLRLQDLQQIRDRYRLYLQSDEWKQKRALVLERDGYVCQACCNATAVEVHHKTYDHIFREPLFDLISVCRACHAKLHPLEHL